MWLLTGLGAALGWNILAAKLAATLASGAVCGRFLISTNHVIKHSRSIPLTRGVYHREQQNNSNVYLTDVWL